MLAALWHVNSCFSASSFRLGFPAKLDSQGQPERISQKCSGQRTTLFSAPPGGLPHASRRVKPSNPIDWPFCAPPSRVPSPGPMTRIVASSHLGFSDVLGRLACPDAPSRGTMPSYVLDLCVMHRLHKKRPLQVSSRRCSHDGWGGMLLRE